jgi:hypothetical protein
MRSPRCSPNPELVLGVAEAGDGVGGFCPELGIFFSSTGPAAYEPQSASGNSADGKCHLPLHASTIAAESLSLAGYGVGL